MDSEYYLYMHYPSITFDYCTFDVDYNSVNDLFHFLNDKTNRFNNCSFSNDSYLNNKLIKSSILSKISKPSFSCHTSIYIKLGDRCNGSCAFCKNKTEDKSPTDISKIIENLCSDDILPHLNEIYFGGGEPSLYLKEIKQILEQIHKVEETRKLETKEYLRLHSIRNVIGSKIPDAYLFTNGGGDWQEILRLTRFYPMKVILSRHEIENEKNKKIVGVDYSLDNPYIKELIRNRKILLSLTCSDLNMRENLLKEYFEFGRELGIKNFIIQTLETKTNINIPYLEEYLVEFKKFLVNQGLKDEKRIISTSYFDLNFLSGYDCSVSLKKYFPPYELESYMKYQPKHSYDLGMDSNGEIYYDFQMIKKLKK